ncbi:amino acid adenylation domain-containing protein [Amycolatopsis rubida]|uniref:Amino acid adenylation domain-containing protein n=1 Tax=Amycolatopsis rubida TaxID=112413 RepID=A0A1I6BMP8_9PSEU|nr:amino acid adenylation domain-containing protein [Amycolatopsis rubida]
MLCSGEALPDELAERFHRLVGAELHNLYGPTEASVDVTATRCLPGETVTIGRAIANTRVYVVDAELREVPVGVPGELVIAGVQLARGYLNRPSLTAGKFVPDPFARQPGGRLYRTGDLARRLPGGRIEYRGRLDHQVKIHGNRIELGEVEATLLTHPDLCAAAAAVHDDRLVGYFVAEPGCTPDPAGLRAYLARTLPEPMLPSVWLALDAVPLTASGKIDRNALPAPDGARTSHGYVPPRTPAEAAVARAFAAATGADRVGAEDSFFALGGDSLRAIRAVGLLNAEGIEASVADLFRRQRVADFAAGLGGPAAAIEAVEPFAQLAAGQREALPDDVTDAYPLSLAQAGMVHEMLAGADRGLYLNHLGYPVHEELRLDALRQAANRLVARHEILRTSVDFAAVPPLQRVHETAVLEVTCDDLRALPAEEQAARIQEYPAEDRARGFDLLSPSLLRLHVHWLAEREWRLSFGYVHAILDGWSQNSLVAELIEDYRAGAADPVGPPPVRFADTVARERESLESTVDRDFWAGRVCAAERFAVPSGWAGEDDGVYRTVRVPFDDLTPRLRAVASSAGVPLKSLLLAAHLTVLRTIAGHDRPFHTGVVTTSRLERVGGDQVRGMFLNTVPFAVPADARDWPELARAVFAEETAMWPHRHFPLPAMQAAWGGQVPLVDVFFNHTDMHVLTEALVDLAEVADSTPNEFGLSVSTVPGAFVLEAFTHRVAVAHLEFLARLYRHVLERIVAAPASDPRRCGLPAPDRAVLLRNPSRTERARRMLPELFEATAAAHPDAPAMRCGEVTLAYRELSVRVARLARYLKDRGVRRGALVGVLLDRGPDLLVALLAVHRAGAAYLPVDPRYPAKRVGYVLADSGVEVVLSEEPLAGLLEGTGCSAVLLDRDAAAIAARPADGPAPRPDAGELAYVIYTSGSTGRPKGVQIGHGALANFLLSMRERPGLAPGAAVLALTTVSFDISALELYLPLLAGGQVIVATAEECVDPQRQAALIERTAPSVVQATPSGLRLLVDSGWTPPAELTVFAGGEKLPDELARRLTAGGARLWDLYGPTETTVWSTVAELDGDQVRAWEPVANTDVYLLGDDLEPVPLGVAGEVWIGGDGLARGYAGRPGLTAERFAPDPHGLRPGGRLYRTGDLARRRPDGSVEILGRADDQVKVRGHRVEPGEVEAALRADPRIRDAVVQPTPSADGLELTAYVVAEGELSIADVRKGLSGVLPDYLVPSGFVLLPELPRTPAGKLDRAALPAPEPVARERPHVAPRGPVEDLVAGVWAEVLGTDRIGVQDDFFDLGGHSVAATRISVRLRAALDADVPVRALFDHPTVESLAAAVAGYPRLAQQPAARSVIRRRAVVGEDA